MIELPRHVWTLLAVTGTDTPQIRVPYPHEEGIVQGLFLQGGERKIAITRRGSLAR